MTTPTHEMTIYFAHFLGGFEKGSIVSSHDVIWAAWVEALPADSDRLHPFYKDSLPRDCEREETISCWDVRGYAQTLCKFSAQNRELCALSQSWQWCGPFSQFRRSFLTQKGWCI